MRCKLKPSFHLRVEGRFFLPKTRPLKMKYGDRCYLKTKPDDIFHAESICLPCDGYHRSCDRYTSNEIMDEIKNRDWQNRNRSSKALDDYVNEVARLNGR